MTAMIYFGPVLSSQKAPVMAFLHASFYYTSEKAVPLYL